jgi:DNA-binding PadR family transcriptional regulator
LSRPEFNLVSYTVLILVGRHGASAHDIVRMMRGGRIYQAAAPSRYYAEPKRLAELGLLEARREPGRTRERTVYRLTEAGEEALRAWAEEPAPFPLITGQPPVRMMMSDIVGEPATRRSLLAMRGEIAELRENTLEARERAASFPHRAKYLRLSASLSLRVLDAYEAWLDEVEEQLAAE